MGVSQGFNQEDGIPTLGRWSVKFKPETPQEIRRAAHGSHELDDYAWARDSIAFTPTPIRDPGVTAATVLSRSVFTGMIEDVDLGPLNESWSLSGPSIMAWLGNGSNPSIGPITFGPYSINNDFATIMVALFSDPADVGGLTDYSAATVSGNTLSDDTVAGENALATIQRYMRQTTTKTEMWVRPDGGCHFAAKGNSACFVQTPEVLFTSTPVDAGHTGDLFLVPGSRFRKTRSWREWALAVQMDNPGTWSSTEVYSTTRYAFNGTTAHYPAAYYESSAPAALNEASTLLYDRHRARSSHFMIEARSNVPCLLSKLKPGDWAYIHDPDTYSIDTGNEVVAGGRLLYPVALRVAEISMPVGPGMGVYRIACSSADPSANYVQDLSDWVEVEQSETTIRFDTSGWSLRRYMHTFPAANPQSPAWR